MADRFGRRRFSLFGITVFTLASLCGLAWSAAALYVARAFQGAGAAFLISPPLPSRKWSRIDPLAANMIRRLRPFRT
jgi:MFS family permease